MTSFINFIRNDNERKILLTVLNWILSALNLTFFFNRKCMVDMDVVITLLNPAKVLFHVWSYDFIFYDTALSTTVTIKLGRAKRFCVSEHSEQRRFRRACVFAQCIFSQKARPLAYLSG